MKTISILITIMFLTACTEDSNTNDSANEDISTIALQKTPGLEDCVLYTFQREKYTHRLNIVRCPGKETISTNKVVSSGKTKTQSTTVFINNKEYIEKSNN